MEIARFHIEFSVFLDKRSTSQVPELPPESIDLYLNEAQERFVKTRYGGNNIYRTTAEETQKRTDDLKAILKTVELNLSLDSLQEAYYLIFPEDYMFLARTRVHSTSPCSMWSKKVKLVQHDDLEILKNDPFNKPIPEEALAYLEGDKLMFSSPSLVYDKAQITYYKRPRLMNLGTYGEDLSECELSEHTHKEIIQIAVDIALENIESQRGQTIKQQLNSIE